MFGKPFFRNGLIMAALLAVAMHCSPQKLNKDVSKADVETLLQTFTEHRFEYNLRGSQVPSNYELLRSIATEKGFDPNFVILALKETKPDVFKALLGKSK